MDYTGYVDGLDVMATEGQRVRCFAFVNVKPGSNDYIQVQTTEHRLQTALELASAKNVRVDAVYDETDGVKVLSRIRLLDRSPTVA